jgi:hypothetical protein
METVFADWASRMTASPAETHLERDDDALSDNERISARGLEILRVLNDLFNTLPGEAEVVADDRKRGSES